MAAVDLEATATDDEAPSLRVSPTTLTVDENDSGDYAIRLNSQPTADVTVTVSGASGAVTVDTAPASGNQNTLTFTRTNWNANQTVTVAAADDGNAVNEMLTLAHAASGGDYGSLSLNELPSASNNSVGYTARLASEPTMATTTVSIASNSASVTVGDTDGDSMNGVQNTLTFTTTNWSTPANGDLDRGERRQRRRRERHHHPHVRHGVGERIHEPDGDDHGETRWTTTRRASSSTPTRTRRTTRRARWRWRSCRRPRRTRTTPCACPRSPPGR